MSVGAARLTDPRVKIFNSPMEYSKIGVIMTESIDSNVKAKGKKGYHYNLGEHNFLLSKTKHVHCKIKKYLADILTQIKCTEQKCCCNVFTVV
jgi:hypothetical protein